MQRAALIDAPVSCACCCVDATRVCVGLLARVDSAGKPVCELCGRRLSKVKHVHKHGPGHACHPRCKVQQQTPKSEATPVAAAVSRVTPRKRRAASDPGQSPEPAAVQALTHRITATEPASTSKMQYNTRREEQIMRLLDETHARRIAAEAADASRALR
jgi:ribosome-binding protein aMBF1 (putative translation factor)